MLQDIPVAAATTRAGTGYDVEQHPLAQSVILHLLPGALGTVVYIAAEPLIVGMGFPPLLAAYLVLASVVILFELGYLLYQGRLKNGKPSLQGIVLYREPIPGRQYFAFVPVLLVWGVLVAALAFPVDDLLSRTVFSWLPNWYLFKDIPQYASSYSRDVLLITIIVGVAFNGIAGPIVEEIYFRGYLLPRLSRFGRWSPPINAALFSLYHFWSPWQFLSRFLLLLPWVYAVWWKRNIYIGIIVHCLVNLISILAIAALLLK